MSQDLAGRALLSHRWPWIILLGLLLGLVGVVTLTTSSTFEDDRYNLGVVRRSADPSATYLLETSLVHLFFEQVALPRAEDWHRGLSLLALRGWAKLVGTENMLLLRLPHTVWVLLWLGLAVGLTGLLMPARSGQAAPRWPPLWVGALLWLVLLLNSWALSILRRAFLDDVPAAVAVLVALWVMGRSPAEVLPVRTILSVGALCGLSFLMKDFYLLWAPLGALLVWLGGRWPFQCFSAAQGRDVALFLLAFGLVALPKLLWSWYELGGVLANPIQYWLMAKFYGHSPVDSHYPFFLYSDLSYRSRVALAGGVFPALGLMLWRPLPEVFRALMGLNFAWFWLLPVAFLRPLGTPWTVRHRLMVQGILLSVSGYSLFFGLGLGEAGQLRYWIVPVTLTVVLGVGHTATLIQGWANASRPGPVHAVRGAVALFFLLTFHTQPLFFGTALPPEPPPLSPLIRQHLAQALVPGHAALLDTHAGIYFWSLYPQTHIVAFPRRHLPALSDAALQRLLDTYHISMIVVHNQALLPRLQSSFGFVELARDGQHILLQRVPLAR